MSSKARGGLSKREWEAAHPGQKAPSDKDSSSSSSSSSDKDIKEYREKLLESLKPTKEEKTLESQISNVESSRDTGIQAIKEEPIEMTPILGQSKNIEERAALELGTLEDRLSRLVSERSASSQALSTALGFAVDDRTYQTQQSQYAQDSAFQQQQFQEGVRQFNENLSLDKQRESRIGSGSDSSKEFNPSNKAEVQSAVYEAVAGGESWPDIVDTLGALGADIGTVDEILQRIYGYYQEPE